MTETLPKSSLVHRVLVEPTSYFALIALALFSFYSFNQTFDQNRLEIDQREIDARLFLQEVSIGAELTPEQTQQATSAYIEEQILVKEAMAMGLDNDTRIHNILAQKLRHVLSGDVIQPSASVLEEFFLAHADKYRSLPTVSVNELIFNTKADLPAEVHKGLAGGSPGDSLLNFATGSNSPLPRVSHLDLANIFSEDFADAVFAATDNIWAGPFISNRGQHWMQVFQRSPALLPELSDIVDLVRLDWIAAEEDQRLNQEVAKLRSKYQIVITNESQ
jgi:hypothetical protein